MKKLQAAKKTLRAIVMNETSGFLNIDKPDDWSSHDVVAKLRRLLGIKRIGHTGTLDPFATGVLPIAIGSSTRLIRFLRKSKAYIAEIDFSHQTETDDFTSDPLVVDYPEINKLYKDRLRDDGSVFWSKDELKVNLNNFIGKTEQIPPLYSAVRIEGKRLYELMRSGQSIDFDDVKRKQVTIHQIRLLEFNYPKATIEMHCSEGTYVRSVARDLGGHLTVLRRIESNGFIVDNSITIDKLEEFLNDGSQIEELLVNNPDMLDLPILEFEEGEILDLQQGKKLSLDNEEFEGIPKSTEGSFIQCANDNNELVGIAELSKHKNKCVVQPKIIL